MQTLQALFCFVLVSAQLSAAQPRLTFNNSATYLGNGGYDWTVYVDADAATLAKIRSVQYTLDPSFPKPIQTVTTRQNKFALSANGWGEFTIYAKVWFTDGTTGSYRYRLNLLKARKEAPSLLLQKEVAKKAAPVMPVNVDTASITTGNTSRSLGGGRWEWAVFILASNDVLKQIQYVEYTLHPTFPEPIQRVTERGMENGKGFVLKATGWGTFEIAVKIVFTNGRSRYLKHQLKFS
jgi:transcription initiation factor IIF auxiliary subunit